MKNSNVPNSITFSKEVLIIPSLHDVGIPIAELGYVYVESELINHRYTGGYWINRGDKLLTYRFWAFNKKKSNFLELLRGQESTTNDSWTIYSPVSGLIVSFDDEQTSETSNYGLVYHGMNRPSLPIILIPKDEPPPDLNNFNTYENMTSWLLYYFYLLPIRKNQDTQPGRLKKFMELSESSNEYYSNIYKALENNSSVIF